MVRIDFLVLGYRKIYIGKELLPDCCSLLLRNSVSTRIFNDGCIYVKENDFQKTKDLLSGRMNYECSDPLGIYGAWIKLKHKPFVLASIVLSIILIFFLSEIVWDIRVEGNSSLTTAVVVESLNDAGFGIGTLWSKINKSNVENAVLQQNSNLSWININRRGTVAYVSVIEKDVIEGEITEKVGFSNIVAKEDCVIEEITVKRGTPMVKIGDSVRKGEILIAGVIDGDKGGFCYAEGYISGRVYDSVEVKIERKNVKKTLLNQKLYSIDIKLFNFFINIFKLYGNLTTEYDIINNEIKYSILGKSRLPISFNLSYIPEYGFSSSYYTDNELIEIAKQRMDSLLVSTLFDADLIAIKTVGNFTNEGYYLFSELVFTKDVGEVKEFNVNL